MAKWIETLRTYAPKGLTITARITVRGVPSPVWGPATMTPLFDSEDGANSCYEADVPEFDGDWDNPAIHYSDGSALWGREIGQSRVIRVNGSTNLLGGEDRTSFEGDGVGIA